MRVRGEGQKMDKFADVINGRPLKTKENGRVTEHLVNTVRPAHMVHEYNILQRLVPISVNYPSL